MNRLSREKQTQIIAALVEGNSLRATARMMNVSKDTVMKLQVEAGYACADFQDKAFQNLTCKRVQVDEIWAFCYAKEKTVPSDKQGKFGYGDVWTWAAIDADAKLIPSFVVGNRSASSARMLIEDLAGRLKSRIQLTSDGLKVYLEAVEGAFGCEIDYSQEETRYSPATCTSCEAKTITGNPDPKHISTSYIERQNLSMRMGIRRFTRLTNGFSKKIENHAAAVG